MKRICFATSGVFWMPALILTVACALVWATVAHAQIIQDDQYDTPAAPSGPAASAQCTASGDTDGVVNAGDEITCAGDFSVSDGSSAVLQDSDETQGTFIDGNNSEITEGSLAIAVTGEPANVNGGNGVLKTDGLFVVATTGVSGGSSSGGSSSGGTGVLSAVTGVLPDTGGPALITAIGVLGISGTGLLLLRRRFNSQ